MSLRTIAIVRFPPPPEGDERPGRELLERIRFGLEAFGHRVGPAEDDVFCWISEVVVDDRSTLVRVGWADDWLVTLDPPPVGPVPRLRGLFGEDPREASEEVAEQVARDLHSVLSAIGDVRWLTPEEHAAGQPGHALPVDPET